MISAFLPKADLAQIKEKLGEDTWKYYRDLFAQGLVKVYYFFGDGTLAYECFYLREYGSFTVNLDGHYAVDDSDLGRALALFVTEMDASSDEEKLRRLYGGDYATLSALASLGPKKAKTFLSTVKKIDDLAYRIGKAQRAESSYAPMVRFLLEPDRGRMQVSLRLGFTKLYMNRKPGAFLRDYYSGNTVQIQKEYVTLPRGSFDPQEEEALQFLYNTMAGNVYLNTSYPITLDEAKLVDFLFLVQGKLVDYGEKTFPVLPVQQVSLSLDEEGSLRCNIPLDIKYFKRVGARAYQFTHEGIALFQFPSPAAGEIFSFYAQAKGIEGSFLAAQMAEKILPLVNDADVSVDPAFADKHPIRRPRIDYYVALEDDRTLSFQTRLYLGVEEVEAARFEAFSSETKRRYRGFLEELSRIGIPSKGKQSGEEDIVTFLRVDLVPVKKYANVFVSEELQSRRVVAAPEMGLRTSSGEDWFSVELYASGYTPEELLQVYRAYSKKKKFVRLRGDYVLLDQANESLRKLSESFAPESLMTELPLYQALKLPSLGGDTDERIKELIRAVGDYGSLELGKLPSPIEKAMRPYQRSGIQFLLNLYRLGLSGILSDDMGLGKTLQSFALFHLIETDGPILVVCPKSLIYNWMDERNKWAPKLPAYILTGSPKERSAIYARMKKKGKAVYFVSYDTLRNDIEETKGIEFAAMTLDEGQYISNTHAMKTKAVKEVQARSRFVLTGTPVQNSLMDLWSIFDFLLPGYFPALPKFKELYGSLDFADEEARRRLLAKIKPFLLGRKKKDVLKELPDKENVTMSLGMNADQQKAYDAYLAKARALLEEGAEHRFNLLAMMTRLRQICVTPGLFLEGEFTSAKIEFLLQTLLDLKAAGRKAIVFSSFVGALELIGRKCKEEGLAPEFITGDTSAKVRVILADRFNQPSSPIDVMLVSLKAGGTGLNLIGADTVFHLDPWWNLAAERQAEDRAYRIGQTNKVTVFKLVIKGSIEEKMLALQSRKGLLIDMADEAAVESALTEEDYQFLLS